MIQCAFFDFTLCWFPIKGFWQPHKKGYTACHQTRWQWYSLPKIELSSWTLLKKFRQKLNYIDYSKYRGGFLKQKIVFIEYWIKNVSGSKGLFKII